MDQEAKDDRLAISVPEAAKRLGISRNNLYQQVRAGKVPGIRLGKRFLIPIKALDQWLEQGGKL